MSRSRRGTNRVLLTALGLAWLAGGALVVLAHVQPALLSPLLDPVLTPIASLDWTLIATGVAVALLAIAAAHTATRGRGRTSSAAVLGDVTVSKAALEDLFRLELGEHPDVLAVEVQPWRARRGRDAWRIALQVRHGARLDQVVDRATGAASSARRRLGAEAPILIHLSGGLRAAVAHSRRAN